MAKIITLDSDRQKRYTKSLIDQIEPDGAMTVVVKKTDKSPTARQMRLRWLWMDEVAKSGIGRFDTAFDVDLGAKYQFAIPILLKDDDIFYMLYDHFTKTIEAYVNKSELVKSFCERHVSISKLMTRRQQAQYLTNFQMYWDSKGVGLTNPDDLKVDLKYNLKKKPL